MSLNYNQLKQLNGVIATNFGDLALESAYQRFGNIVTCVAVDEKLNSYDVSVILKCYPKDDDRSDEILEVQAKLI